MCIINSVMKGSLSSQVAFPYLYNNRPRKVRLSVYHYPMVMYIKAEDPDLPAFYFDPLINPMPSYKSELRTAGVKELTEEELDEFELPDVIEPFLPVSTSPTLSLWIQAFGKAKNTAHDLLSQSPLFLC